MHIPKFPIFFQFLPKLQKKDMDGPGSAWFSQELVIAGGQGTLHQHSNHHKASNQCCPNLGMPGSRVIRMAFHSQAASNDQRVSNVSTFRGELDEDSLPWSSADLWLLVVSVYAWSGWNLIAEKSQRTGATNKHWAVPLPCWNTGACPGCPKRNLIHWAYWFNPHP
jgi:hypothetical protein